MKKYVDGSIVKCQVTGLEKYGIFVRVDSNYNGLIHISEVSSAFVKSVSDYVYLGEKIYAKVIGVDKDLKQLKLSIKDIEYRRSGKDKLVLNDSGFKPLEDNLKIWTKEKIEEYNL